MSRNGAGQYEIPVGSWYPPISGTPATAADWQVMIEDLAAAMTQSIARDGQTTILQNLPMGGNKLTGLSAGTAAGDSLRYEQLFSQGQPKNLASAATTDIGAQLTTNLNVTGTTTITSFGVNYNGPRFLRFNGALTLTHSATLVLPGGVNIQTTAGDIAIVIPIGTPASGWAVAAYQRTGVQLLNVRAFTTPGVTTYTPTAGTNSVIVEVQGGGGGSGGTSATTAAQQSYTSGGGGGAYAKGRFTSGFNGVSITVGAGGAGGVFGVSGGGNGGASSFGGLISAGGGSGSSGGPAQSGVGVQSGVAGGTVIYGANIVGASGSNSTPVLSAALGFAIASFGGTSGMGGASYPGGGGDGKYTAPSSPATTGSTGYPGIVIIWEYA